MTKRRARSAGDQYDPHALHRRGPAGEVRPSRHAHGAGAAGLHAVEPGHALRSEGPDLAQSRPLRPVERPCLDAAVVGPVPDGHARGECGLRAAGRAVGHARRHPPFPPARQQGAGAPGIPLGLGSRDDNRSAGSGDRHQRRHGDRAQVAGQPVQQAGLRGLRLQHLCHLRRRLPDGGRRLGSRLARRPPRASTTCAGSTTTTTSPSRARRASPSRRMWRRASGPTAGTCCTSAMPTICADRGCARGLPRDEGPADADRPGQPHRLRLAAQDRYGRCPWRAPGRGRRCGSSSAPTAGRRTPSSSCPRACASTSMPASAGAAAWRASDGSGTSPPTR